VAVEAGFCDDDTDLARHEPEYMSVKLTVVGCSPAWPNPGGAQSGYLLEGPGRLLLDCGPGVLAKLREREAWPDLDAIAITHWHLDHWGDLVPWVWGATLGPGIEMRQPELWVPPEGREMLRAIGGRLGRPEMFDRSFDVHEYGEREPFKAAGFEVTAFRVPHYGLETYALRVERNGRSLTYSGDAAPSNNLVDAARGADLFLCEATLAESGEEGERGHLSASEAVAAFDASGARRLVIIHRPDELELDSDLERAYDGLELSV
jgi:ribonuclease BN (tRNA processing enzyme)